MDGSRVKSVLLPLGGVALFSGIAGAVYYFFNKKDDDDLEMPKSCVEKYTTTRVKVPVDAVGLVIGRQGANIKLIQTRTNTKIDFADEEIDGQRNCCIQGSEENINLAQQLILKAVQDKPVVQVEEMLVPQIAVGRIIGRNGEAIRRLSHTTGAKVIVEREQDRPNSPTYPEDMRKIILKGSKEQIDAAKTQLLEKVSEEASVREQISASATNMYLRAKGRHSGNETEPTQSAVNGQESLSLGNSERFLEVYVSAVNSATHFWLQVVGQRSIQLDKLVTEMTEYYSSDDNRELHQLDTMKEGSVVAAKFPHDSSWYRGRVCESQEGATEGEERRRVTVYYVDFGDTETVEWEAVCELRTDFLRLSFQAIECSLAYIDPKSAEGDEAADAFEELTFAAQWRPVMVKVVEYRQQADNNTLPCVQIIDTSGPADVDVAEELVRRGLAKLVDGASPSISS